LYKELYEVTVSLPGFCVNYDQRNSNHIGMFYTELAKLSLSLYYHLLKASFFFSDFAQILKVV
jgi:hypothetical protein